MIACLTRCQISPEIPRRPNMTGHTEAKAERSYSAINSRRPQQCQTLPIDILVLFTHTPSLNAAYPSLVWLSPVVSVPSLAYTIRISHPPSPSIPIPTPPPHPHPLPHFPPLPAPSHTMSKKTFTADEKRRAIEQYHEKINYSSRYSGELGSELR